MSIEQRESSVPAEEKSRKKSFYKTAVGVLIGYGVATGKIALVVTGLALLEFGITQQGSVIEKIKRRLRKPTKQK